VAAKAIQWTRERISDEAREWLSDLPCEVEHEGVLLCHGAPSDPDNYILGAYAAAPEFSRFGHAAAFYGHTHVPAVYALQPTEGAPVLRTLDPSAGIAVTEGWRYLINPGSVGQPRDGDPRAAFMVMDTDSRWISLHRVIYPVAQVQALMRAEGLPRPLVERLASGI
jgi:diadenosine tetraphosphatase ApaH/serine/threonine PP2A family protein phosphatase